MKIGEIEVQDAGEYASYDDYLEAMIDAGVAMMDECDQMTYKGRPLTNVEMQAVTIACRYDSAAVIEAFTRALGRYLNGNCSSGTTESGTNEPQAIPVEQHSAGGSADG